MKSYQQFFAELKRRKVFQVSAVYGAVAFGLIQVAEPLANAMRLPETFLPFVVAILLLGYPLALVLAWAFEVTPDGMQRTGSAPPGEIEAIVAAPAAQRWPAGVLALLGVAALVASTWWVARRTAPDVGDAAERPTDVANVTLAAADLSEDERPTIAVLPFADLSPEGDQEYFGDGMTEEILNTLAKIHELRVAGRTSAFAYKGENKDLRAIGAELGVAYLVEGSIRKDGDQLRITAQLIDAGDGTHLWSESYDRPLENVFQIQREIAESIATELRVPLGLEDPDDLVTPTSDLEAYDLYLAGRARMREREEAMGDALRLFEAAVARDSNWAPAWAGLAEASELVSWYEEAWAETPDDQEAFDTEVLRLWQQAETAAGRALALDPDNSSALVAIGSVLRNRREWEASESAYRRALASDPDNPEAYQQYGEMLLDVGRIAEGRRMLDRAVALDRVPVRILWSAFGLWTDDRVPDAIRRLEAGVDEFPGYDALKMGLLWAYLEARRFEEAAAALDRLIEPAGHHGLTGDASGTPLERLRRGDLAFLPVGSFPEPLAWAILGYPDSALARIPERADMLLSDVAWMWNPALDPLRDEPAFQEAMRRQNLTGREALRTPR